MFKTYFDPLIGHHCYKCDNLIYICNRFGGMPITKGYNKYYVVNGTLRGVVSGKDEIVFYNHTIVDQLIKEM